MQARGNLIRLIGQRRQELRRSEQKVADRVLRQPEFVTQMSITALADASGVSEPTVVRFCRGVGCDGFSDFKIRLAQSLVTDAAPMHRGIEPDDSIADLLPKIVDSTVGALTRLGDDLDFAMVERAIDAIAGARKVEFYGVGASGAVAVDAQHKFFRLDIPSIAYCDPHMQTMSASILGARDVVVAISHTGRSPSVVESARLAVESRATVIAITSSGSPLAEVVEIPLCVDAPEDTDVYTPMISRLAHLVVIDVLATGVAMRRGPAIAGRLRKMKDNLRRKRLGDVGLEGRSRGAG